MKQQAVQSSRSEENTGGVRGSNFFNTKPLQNQKEVEK